MRAGRLRHRLVIQKDEGNNDDALGGRSEDWQTLLDVRATASYTGGKELERARQVIAQVSTLFVIRYDARLEPIGDLSKMRIRSKDDDLVHEILYADDPARDKREIHIYAARGQK